MSAIKQSDIKTLTLPAPTISLSDAMEILSVLRQAKAEHEDAVALEKRCQTKGYADRVVGMMEKVSLTAARIAEFERAIARVDGQNAYRSELTPAGEQLVIPGCEQDQAPGIKQLSLF